MVESIMISFIIVASGLVMGGFVLLLTVSFFDAEDHESQ
jgi:hypothetical protein